MKLKILLLSLCFIASVALAQAASLAWDPVAPGQGVTNYVVYRQPLYATNFVAVANTGTNTTYGLPAADWGAAYYVRSQNAYALSAASSLLTNYVPAAPASGRITVTLTVQMP